MHHKIKFFFVPHILLQLASNALEHNASLASWSVDLLHASSKAPDFSHHGQKSEQ